MARNDPGERPIEQKWQDLAREVMSGRPLGKRLIEAEKS